MADGVDTSVYGRIGGNQQQTSPLQMLQMMGQMNQLKLQGMDINQKNAVDAVYKKAQAENRPVTTQELAGTGYNAGAEIQQGAQAQKASLENRAAQREQALGAFSSLAARPNLNSQDVNKTLVELSKTLPDIPAETLAAMTDQIFADGTDPEAMRRNAGKLAVLKMGTGALSGVTGRPLETGEQTQIPAGRALLESVGETQRTPQSSLPSNGVVSSNTSPTANVGRITTLGIGEPEALKASADMFAADRNRSSTYAADMQPMTELQDRLKKLGPTGTGPLVDELNTWKSLLQTHAAGIPGAAALIGDPDKITDVDIAKKLFTQVAGMSASRYGHGQVSALETAILGSPNSKMSNAGAQEANAFMIGLRRLDQTKFLEAQRLGNIKPGQYATWASKWATQVDPRAFAYDQMNEKQRQRLREQINKNPKEKEKFNNTMQMMVDNGIIGSPKMKNTSPPTSQPQMSAEK